MTQTNTAAPRGRPTQKKKAWRRDLASLVALLLVLLAARSSIAEQYYVPSGSMEPTIDIGDRVLVDKRAYGLRLPFTDRVVSIGHGPERGDVVVLHSPERDIILIKRVVAVPGDEVFVRDGRVWLQGKPVEVGFARGIARERLGDDAHPVRFGGPDYGPTMVPPDSYLVMGDDRGNSHDGRSFGLVKRKTILGKAIGVFHGRDGFTWRDL